MRRLASVLAFLTLAGCTPPVVDVARQGDPVAQNEMGYESEANGQLDQAMAWYQLAAEQGDPMAQCNLASLYLHGPGGVERNDKLAAAWATRSARQGNPRCEFLLGWMYAHGAGVAEDPATARHWLEAAIASGDAVYAGRAQQELAAEAVGPAQQDSTALAHAQPRSVTARYDHGSYIVDGTADGAATSFTVDTGTTRTIVDSMLLTRAGLQPIDRDPVRLANGAEDTALVYVVPQLCVGPLCVTDMRVLAGVEGLLGTDFLRAAQAKVTIADGVLTLARGE